MFYRGFKAMLPITAGVIPFGLVMGTVGSGVSLSLFEMMSMNLFLFAGACQLAAIDLLSKDISLFVIIITGLVINLRFMLYSASFSLLVKEASFMKKLVVSYCLTDQTFAVLSANTDDSYSPKERISFYLGSSLCMVLAWQIAVLCGFIFGNMAPASLSLDYAVPLSFIALTLPSVKDKNYVIVVFISALMSILLHDLPMNGGLLVSGVIAISAGAFLSRNKRRA